MYGRLTADRLTFGAVVRVVTTNARDADLLGSRAWPGEPGGKPATIRGHDVVVYGEGDNTQVSWLEPDGRAVGILGTGVTEGDFVTAAEGVSVGPEGAWLALRPGGYVTANLLPGDFLPVFDGRWPPEPANWITDESWVPVGARNSGGASRIGQANLTLSVYEEASLSLNSVAWQHDGGRRTEVGGSVALDAGGRELARQAVHPFTEAGHAGQRDPGVRAHHHPSAVTAHHRPVTAGTTAPPPAPPHHRP